MSTVTVTVTVTTREFSLEITLTLFLNSLVTTSHCGLRPITLAHSTGISQCPDVCSSSTEEALQLSFERRGQTREFQVSTQSTADFVSCLTCRLRIKKVKAVGPPSSSSSSPHVLNKRKLLSCPRLPFSRGFTPDNPGDGETSSGTPGGLEPPWSYKVDKLTRYAFRRSKRHCVISSFYL